MRDKISKSELILYTQPPDLVVAAIFATLICISPLVMALPVLTYWDSNNIYDTTPVWAIALSLFATFVIAPSGFVSLIFAILSNSCYLTGKNQKAWRYSNIAKWLLITGTILAIGIFIFAFSYLGIYGLDDPDY